ncbi:hypothetical protein IJH29_00605 [Candidatus Saccharibacteria bacterium]|nr:hypothetical protein [Candidatus Saccharibacteria bacterium]
MYAQPEPTAQKKKIIIVSTVMGLIILALIGVLINAIVKKNQAKPVEETTLVREDEKPSTTVAENDKSESPSAEDGNLAPVAGGAVAAVEPSSDVKEMPKTGPESTLGLALLLGAVVVFLTSRSESTLLRRLLIKSA